MSPDAPPSSPRHGTKALIMTGQSQETRRTRNPVDGRGRALRVGWRIHARRRAKRNGNDIVPYTPAHQNPPKSGNSAFHPYRLRSCERSAHSWVPWSTFRHGGAAFHVSRQSPFPSRCDPIPPQASRHTRAQHLGARGNPRHQDAWRRRYVLTWESKCQGRSP